MEGARVYNGVHTQWRSFLARGTSNHNGHLQEKETVNLKHHIN
jgi:hypothetical protein